jgi:hypothetical protein
VERLTNRWSELLLWHALRIRASSAIAIAQLKRSRDASRPANGVADYHPLDLGRFAPSNKRMQRTLGHASKLACPPAADPQRR